MTGPATALGTLTVQNGAVSLDGTVLLPAPGAAAGLRVAVLDAGTHTVVDAAAFAAGNRLPSL